MTQPLITHSPTTFTLLPSRMRGLDTSTEIVDLAALTESFVEGANLWRIETTADRGFDFPSDQAATEPANDVERPEVKSQEDLLHAELLSYRDLPEGWDGYKGVPASSDAVADALGFLAMQPSDSPLPYPQIGSDGEVGLYWHTEEVFAEVSLCGNGEFSYYARYIGAEPLEYALDDCRIDAGRWPDGLLLIHNRIGR